MTEAIKKFWDEQALEHGGKDTATAPDTAYRELEISRIKDHIKGMDVLDVGCGNGYSTFKFARAYPYYRFEGIDFSNAMISQARARSRQTLLPEPAIPFFVEDVRHLGDLNDRYDTIISERCLINLLTWEEQSSALVGLKTLLKPGGRIILVENFADGLWSLNNLRKAFGLHEITQRWHNRYFVLKEFEALVEKEFVVRHKENIGNLYYIISRVVQPALLAMEGKQPSYDHPLNRIASNLPSLGDYNFSPNMLYVLEAKEE